MKIESSTKPVGDLRLKETRTPTANKTAAAAGEEVLLSPLSAQLSASDGEQSFDAARVSEIKQAISEGRFAINASAIADRLITSAKELVDSRRQA